MGRGETAGRGAMTNRKFQGRQETESVSEAEEKARGVTQAAPCFSLDIQQWRTCVSVRVAQVCEQNASSEINILKNKYVYVHAASEQGFLLYYRGVKCN